ncbi:MAG: gamma-glutamyl-gamma-aminobutyrate hydrolase family protein [Firmicutes bacterium]|nr:gamma-glutamyl-gamma-aminobutyrate hydrolase family protein [Bacillota bacterium]
MRPRIGISVNVRESHGRVGSWLGEDYADGIMMAGGIPLALPNLAIGADESGMLVEDLADAIDGLLLTGGEDVDPQMFGEEPRHGLGEISPIRDRFESALLQAMLRRDKPIFGICRGIQLMNAALGGTLYQDLSRQWAGSLQHSQRAPRDHLAHAVTISPDSNLRGILGSDQVGVNTFHHQAIHGLAPGFVATAVSSDGLIEAFEMVGRPHVFGVQWHPENLWRKHPLHRRLFTAFVDSAAALHQVAHV